MSTSRGVTDTKVYDRQGVIDRYGIPPELVPDFIGLKGDTSDNIPGVPGIGDKTAADLLQRFGDLETVLGSVDQISGAKRKENLTNHADDARMSKQLATMVRDVPIDIDLEAEFTREPDRANLRAVFRDWELRDPLRRLEEALEAAELEAIPRPEDSRHDHGEDRPRAHARRHRPPARASSSSSRSRPPEIPEGELIPREPKWRFAAYAGGNIALAGETDDPAEVVAAAGDRAVIAHDAKALGDVPRNLVFDTEVAAYLLDPARRGYPLDELVRGARDRRRRGRRARHQRRAHPRAGQAPAPADPRARPDRLLNEIELPLVHVLREMREGRRSSSTPAARDRRDPHQGRRDPARARDLGDRRRGVRHRLAAAARRRPVRQAQALAQAPRQDRLLHRRPRPAGDPRRARDHPQDRALPRAVASSPRPTSTRCRTGSATTAACTPRSSRRRPPPAACPRSTRTCRTSRSAPRPAARSAPASSPSPATACSRVDYSQVELRVLAHIAGEQVLQGHLRPRRGRAHRDRVRRLRAPARAARRRHALEGQDGQLRDRLRPLRLRAEPTACGSRRRRRRSSSTATSTRFPAVAQFMKDAVEQAEQHGYVSTLFGRRRQIPEIRARNWQMRKLGERLAVNTVIQGTAADIIKVAMVRCHDALAAAGLETRVILQIHDELLFEGPAGGDGAGDGDRHARDGRRGRHRPAADGGRRRRARTGSTRSSVQGMKLENEFTVPARSTRHGPCCSTSSASRPACPAPPSSPAATTASYNGTMTVKIGPITARYKGSVRIQEADEAARRAVMRAQAKDARGQGTRGGDDHLDDGGGRRGHEGQGRHRHARDRPGGPVRPRRDAGRVREDDAPVRRVPGAGDDRPGAAPRRRPPRRRPAARCRPPATPARPRPRRRARAARSRRRRGRALAASRRGRRSRQARTPEVLDLGEAAATPCSSGPLPVVGARRSRC